NGMRCIADLPGMLGMMEFCNLVILGCPMRQALSVSLRINVFTYVRVFTLYLETKKTHPYE
ncbi:hypothetical protein ACQP3F_35015, partial [Escherichia coli]